MRVLPWLLAAWLLVTPWFHGGLWLSPLYWLVCALALAPWAWRMRRRRLAGFAGAVAVAALALMTPALANTLLRWIERPVATSACQEDADRQLVLLTGGTYRAARDQHDIGALTEASVLRATAFGQRFRSPDARLVVVAGGGVGGVPESVLVARLLELSGFSTSRIRTERASMSTWETARLLREDMQPAHQRIVLATSALHMARSAQAFRAQGFDVCECALFSEYVEPGPLATFFPQSTALRKSERVLHELVGGVVYRWRP